MKVICLSDLHGHLPTDIPESDVLVIAGDICPEFSWNIDENVPEQSRWVGTRFAEWIDRLNRPVIATLGNHDWLGQTWGTADFDAIPNLTLLMDASCELDGRTFYGSPWSVRYGKWAYMQHDAMLDPIYRNIPMRVDMLITHSPPYGHRDLANRLGGKERAGSRSLDYHVERTKPKYVVCGHIHEARGVSRIGTQTTILNVAYLTAKDGGYQPWHRSPKYYEVTL